MSTDTTPSRWTWAHVLWPVFTFVLGGVCGFFMIRAQLHSQISAVDLKVERMKGESDGLSTIFSDLSGVYDDFVVFRDVEFPALKESANKLDTELKGHKPTVELLSGLSPETVNAIQSFNSNDDETKAQLSWAGRVSKLLQVSGQNIHLSADALIIGHREGRLVELSPGAVHVRSANGKAKVEIITDDDSGLLAVHFQRSGGGMDRLHRISADFNQVNTEIKNKQKIP